MAENVKRQLQLAEALRLRQRAVSAPVNQADESVSFGDRMRGFRDTTADVVNEVNRGLLFLLPSQAREQLNKIGVGVETELSGTPVGRGLNVAGASLPFAVAPVVGGSVGASLTPNLSKISGTFKTLIDDIAKYATANPKTYLSGEAVSAAGAGTLGETIRQEGGGPAAQLAGEVVGSLAGGPITALPRTARAARESINANLLPMTEEGGSIRAARQMQERAGGPEAAAQAAQRLESIPEGVTPAQWIGDERLMAQEARLLRDNPELENIVRAELMDARIAAQESLLDSFGQPRTRQQWEVSVLNRVTPEDFQVTPGQTDEMLNQAYKSFEPLYDGAKGHPIPINGISNAIKAAPNTPDIMATNFEREVVDKWLASRLTAYGNKLSGPEVDSEVLLKLRSDIRNERRLQTQRGRDERADLLGAAESVLTQRIQEGLPEGAVDILRQADSQYRKYKVVENAIFNAADSNLTPEDMTRAIQQGGLATVSQYARGVDETVQELRRVAMSGRSTEEVLGDPQRAELFVRGLTDSDRAAVHADFVDVLYNRAKSQTDVTPAGVPYIDGQKLLTDVMENKDVMRSLGMTNDEINKLSYMGEQMLAMSKRSPESVAQLFEDGPASILQLAAALGGAKTGQRMAGQGLGSSLVIAQYMSNKARGTLASLTSNEAERLMKDAATDPKLYGALLTKSVLTPQKMRERAAYMESWLMGVSLNRLQDDEQ